MTVKRFTLVVAALLTVIACGAAAASADRALRSVNGERLTAPAVAPWNAFVDAPDGTCSGTVIDLSRVLTAAACVFSGSQVNAPATLKVSAGAVRLAPGTDAGTLQTRGVSAVTVHPGFGQRRYKLAGAVAEDNFSFAYDLALLTLVAPLQQTPQVSPVALADAALPDRSRVRIVGWGDPTFGAFEDPGVARSMTSQTTRPSLCADGNPSLLCMVSRQQSPCAGDSGAGVVSTGAAPKLVAIHSFHDGKCVTGESSGATGTTEPGVARWLSGTANPPLAPSTLARPTIALSGTRRRQLVCRGPRWRGATQTRIVFVDDRTQRTLKSGSRLFRPTGSTRLRHVYCASIATNDGGTTEASSNKAIKVGTR